jgi:hypothetical protein
VVREFGPMRRVTGLQITNEVNIAFSPNTSDGAYRRSVEALVRGVVAAKRESLRRGYAHQTVGFNFAWRFVEDADAGFWEALGRRGGRRLRRHTDWVGIDIYPGSWTPGVFFPAPIADFGDAFLEGIAQTRECYMPRAGFGSRVPLRIEETGYGTGPGRSEADQATATAEFARAPTATAVPTTSATSASSAYATTTAPGRAFSSTSASCARTTARSPPSTSFAARSAATGRARAGPAEVGGAAAP